MVHFLGLGLVPVLVLVLQKPHSHVHAHVVYHPLNLVVLDPVDRSSETGIVVGIAYYSVLSHQLDSIEGTGGRKQEWTYSEGYVVVSYSGCRIAEGVLLGLALGGGYLGYGSYDVEGGYSSLVPDRACREV